MEVPVLPPWSSVDLCLEIFTRLDAKSLARSKSVCKKWFDFLSHPDFSKHYSRRRPSMTGFFYSSSQGYKAKLRYLPLDDGQEPVLEPSSCLGFLDSPAILYDSTGGLLHWATSWNNRYISNPLTQKFIRLGWPYRRIEFVACGIAFNPTVSADFEVVVLITKPNFSLEPSIFTSETMEWNKLEEIEVCDYLVEPYERFRGIFLEGSLYWETKQNRLLGYRVKDRAARIIELPVENNHELPQIPYVSRGCLGSHSGRLHYGRITDQTLRVWVSSDCCNSWELKHRINFSQFSQYWCSNAFDQPQALAFTEDCEGVWMSMARKIVHWRFDGEDGGARDVLEVQREGSMCIQPSMFFPFVHSVTFSRFSSSHHLRPCPG